MKKFLVLVVTFITVLQTVVISQAVSYKGDVDNNGSVNSTDALIILQYAVGMNDGIDESKADVNSDKAINSTDALIVLQTSVGLVSLAEIPNEPELPNES